MTVRAVAPTRVCDLGGWTDTWFAGHGAVLNIAVSPMAVAVVERGEVGSGVELHVPDFGDVVRRPPGGVWPGRHPLLEQSIEAVGGVDDVVVRVSCDAPPGASMGTSAAVCVALLGALNSAFGAQRAQNALEIARLAHSVETDRLGLQSGVQDQVASALGGVQLIEVPSYPTVVPRRVSCGDALLAGLSARLVVVFLGRGHDSSAVHEAVIAELTSTGASKLERLRRCAYDGAAALEREDLEAFGRVMVDNTEAQASLHPSLVGDDAATVIEFAASCGASGWKVNGAGGSGGTVAVLCGAAGASRRSFVEAVDAHDVFSIVPTAVSTSGVSVTASSPPSS